MNLSPISKQTSEYSLLPFFELTEDFLCVAGYDGYFKKINPAFVKLLGYSEQELFSFPISHLIHEPDKKPTSEFRDQLLKGKPLLNFENRYLTKSGEIVWLTWTSIVVKSEQLVYAIAKNITHIKKREEETTSLITELSSLNNELTQLSYTTTHDLKSPVNNLISLFSLMDVTEMTNEDNLLYLDLLKKSAENLRDTLNRYIDNIKERNKASTINEDLNLEQVLEDTIQPIQYLIKTSNTSLKLDFSEAKFLKSNSFYLHSIFLNLISNSIKYARPGIPLKIEITSKRDGNSIVVIFKDNGLGFDLKKFGNRIFKLNETFHNHPESKGVGLYLVYNYMQALGGSVNIESEVNNGATFTLGFVN